MPETGRSTETVTGDSVRPARFDSGNKQGAQLALLRDQAQQFNRHTFSCSGSPPSKPAVARVTCPCRHQYCYSASRLKPEPPLGSCAAFNRHRKEWLFLVNVRGKTGQLARVESTSCSKATAKQQERFHRKTQKLAA